ncbi:MAG: hypothetical protein E7319_06750 [Clostridiales bacterium]|nr:hypothetical protein [Clostridiales bacterium]
MIRRTSCIIARSSDPCRNLAIEKHLMDTLPEDTAILFLYQNDCAVTVGRNQNPWYECNVEPYLESGGTLTRRLSGGGTVYQDPGVLNFSFILPKTHFNTKQQLNMAAAAVQRMGIPVQSAPGGSIASLGRIFSQNAFFKAGSTALHNGSLLVHANIDAMESFLLPGGKRLKGKARPKIDSLYGNLREISPEITIEGLEESLYNVFASTFGTQPVFLDEQMLDERTIEQLTLQFANPDWVYPEALPYNFSVDEHFPWGDVTVLLWRENGVIRASRIFSDAMEAALFDRIQQALTGCPFLIGAIGTRFQQRLGLIKDPRLLQIAGDVCTLICGRIRAMDRQGEGA